MTREPYVEAEMEVILFLANDVITTSDFRGEDPLPDEDLF